MNFDLLLKQHAALMTKNWITNLANTSAFLFYNLPRINWVGFYLMENQKLWLGPFQGKPACTEIELDRGVCGKAASTQKTILVSDVHDFDGHIVCDPASRSEIVVPIMLNKKVIAVLDVDSPVVGRFNENDQVFLENIVKNILQNY
jgi:L-methionine (R)-S-oxide reductase